MQRRVLAVAAALVALSVPVLATPAHATSDCTTTFTAANNNVWLNPLNWDNGVPTATSVACIDGNPHATIVGDAAALRIEGTGVVTLGNDLGNTRNPGTLTLGSASASTSSTIGIVLLDDGQIHLLGQAKLTADRVKDGFGSAFDLGTAGELDLGYAEANSVFNGTGSVVLEGEGYGGADTESYAGMWIAPGVTVVTSHGGSLRFPGFAIAQQPVQGGTVDVEGGTMQLSLDGPTRLVTSPAATVTLSGMNLPAGNPPLQSTTTIVTAGQYAPDQDVIVHDLTLAGPTTFEAGTLAAGVTLTANGATKIAGAFDDEGTIAGGGTLSVTGLLRGTGSVSPPTAVTSGGEVDAPLHLGSLSIDSDSFLGWGWDSDPLSAGTVTMNGRYALDGPGDTTVGASQPVLDATSYSPATVAGDDGSPTVNRSYLPELSGTQVIARAHDATSIVTTEQTSTDPDGAATFAVRVSGAASEPGATGTVGLFPLCCDTPVDIGPLSGGAVTLHVPAGTGNVELLYTGDARHQWVDFVVTVPKYPYPPAPPSPSPTPTPRPTPTSTVQPTPQPTVTPTPRVHVPLKLRVLSTANHTLVVAIDGGAAGRGVYVTVQVLRHGRWVTLGRLHLNKAGKGRLTNSRVGTGHVRLRMVIAETERVAAGVTPLRVTLG